MDKSNLNFVNMFIFQIAHTSLVENHAKLFYWKRFEQNGVTFFPLVKVYPKRSIEQLVKRKGFVSSYEKWRTRSVPDGYLCDVYDGLIWRKFNSAEGANLILSSPHCWLLTLNLNWFEPFECGGYSVEAIYLSIQNLPRDVRFRPENIILVGVYYQDQRSLKRQLIPIWLL